ncbi:MAG: hypothetical protein KJP25_11165 [Gammaproteobacteria bacterium]|nr:hypothetical protein [Gammaproteobacteria bacterium]NND39862.1 hypothetical protein [Pseudomonadales bacterium]MBT8151486.1 hypothetical protein [Gammaproteobacteria bacterium]NNL11243.1 hypothetical protein [Pseudomonadales bacterium]NNM11090.1 hypothetical protein [Pseudomonadales bacterium]
MKKKNNRSTASGARQNSADVLSLQGAAEKRDKKLGLGELDLTPVFEDPRKLSDRRKRNSVFFVHTEERRHASRRNACMLENEWWMSRNYSEAT